MAAENHISRERCFGPAKPHASRARVKPLDFDKYLERYSLQSGWITKVIEIAEKILDLEPHDRATVLAGATVTFNWLVSAVQAGIPGLPPQYRRTDN